MSTTEAIIMTQFGGPEVLSIGTAPLAELSENDVLVTNYATGVNPVDFKARKGLDPSETIDPANPMVLGWDGAGVVEKVGSAVKHLAVGNEVYYAGNLKKPGSYARQTVVDARMVAVKPKSLTFEEACTIPLVAETCHEALVEGMHVEPGKTLLIYNGAGGVGSFTIQYAKAIGLTVIATASRPETVAFVKELGADFVINHREKDLAAELEKAGAPRPDYVFDLCDNIRLGELLKLLKPLGRAALIWTLDPKDTSIDWTDLFFQRKSIVHELMFTRAMFGVDLEKQKECLEVVAKYIDQGKIKHVLQQTFPWDQVKEAHAMQESGKVMGKLALSIDTEKSKTKGEQ